MFHKIMLFLLAAVFLFTTGGCGLANKAKDKIPSLELSAGGTGAAAASAAAGVGTFMADIVQKLGTFSVSPKPSRSAQVAVGDQVDCDSGYVEVTSVAPVFSATAHGCVGNNGTVVADGTTMTGTLSGTVNCDTDTETLNLPTDFNVTINGPISIGGVDFTFTNMGMNITGITYGPSLVASPYCAVTGFTNEVTGVIGSSDPVDVSFNFGTSSVVMVVTVSDESVASLNMSGTMTANTPCFNGSFNIATVTDLSFPPGATCPISGQLDLSGGITGSVIFPDDCENPACILGL